MPRPGKKDEEESYWKSFTDLMAGLMIVFMLLLIGKMYKSNNQIKELKNDKQKIEEELKETKERELLKDSSIQQIADTRFNIIENLKTEFENKNIPIIIDSKTGAIRLSEGVLFDFDKSDLKPEGQEYLQKIMPLYLGILLEKPEIKEHISQIIIEGHTDDKSTYIYNLRLSQARALSVVEYLLSDKFSYSDKDELQEYLTANGRSFSELIIDENGDINRDASRRVEIKFRLKEEELLSEIQQQISKGNE